MITYGRSWQTGSDYRYGFNGKEQDDEVIGDGNVYDYGARIFNSRIGKFLSIDPLTNSFPYLTPYQFASNQPIWAIDLDGSESKIITNYTSILFDENGCHTVTRSEEIILPTPGPLGIGTLNVNVVEENHAVNSTMDGSMAGDYWTSTTLEYLDVSPTGEGDGAATLIGSEIVSGNYYENLPNVNPPGWNNPSYMDYVRALKFAFTPKSGLIGVSEDANNANDENRQATGEITDYGGLIKLLNGAGAFDSERPEDWAEGLEALSEWAVLSLDAASTVPAGAKEMNEMIIQPIKHFFCSYCNDTFPVSDSSNHPMGSQEGFKTIEDGE